MITKIFLLVFIVFTCCNCVIANDWNIANIPDSLVLDSKYITRYSSEKIEVFSKEKSIYSVTNVYTFFSESDAEEVNLFFSQFQKIENLKLTTYDREGFKLKDYGKKDFSDHSVFDGSTIHSDNRRLEFILEGKTYPYTMEMSYQITYSSNFILPDFWIQSYNEAIQDKEVILSFPTSSGINFRSYNLPPQTDSSHINNNFGKEEFKWKFTNLKAIKYLPFSVPSMMTLPMIKCASMNFSLADIDGSLKDWESFSTFIYKLNKPQSIATPEMTELAIELTKNATTEKEKIEAIYKYVKDKMRYVAVTIGASGWQPWEASYVNKNFIGDCKALSNYTMTLLREVGIESNVALITRGNKRKAFLDVDFADNNFNHMVVYVPSQDLWLECTSKTNPPGYLGFDNEDRYALIVKETGGGLKRTKKLDEFINVQELEVTIKIKETGIHEVEFSKILMGEDHETMRYFVDNLTKEELEKRFVNGLDQVPVNIHSLDISYDKDQATARVKATFTIAKIGNISGNRLFLTSNPIDKILTYGESQKEERTQPFFLEYNSTNKCKITFLLPEDYSNETKMLSVTHQSEFGSYEVTTAYEDNKYIYTRTYVNKNGIFEADKYKKYIQFCKDYNKLENGKAVFIKAN